MDKRRIGKNLILVLLTLVALILLSSCGQSNSNRDEKAPEIKGLTFDSQMKLDYAECFDIYNYSEGYSLIDVHDDNRYLIVPEGKKAPENLDSDIVVVPQNPSNIYMGATSVMALFDSMDALAQVRLTELKEKDWTLESAAKAMSEGQILYAGKYSQPDYELILKENCDLAIESTMIYHNPEVKEMIEKLGIPVFVDRSSYESDPLGRAEWIKVYGVISGHLDKAESFFKEQKEIVANIDTGKNTDKTVVFFYITTSGKVVVRSSTDYVPAMIRKAGGTYAFDNLKDDSGKSSISMTMESFYEGAKNADYLVYNGTIDSSVKTLEDLEGKSEIFSKFKAVKSGNCYMTGSLMYQRTDMIGSMIKDFYRMLSGEETEDMVFLTKME